LSGILCVVMILAVMRIITPFETNAGFSQVKWS